MCIVRVVAESVLLARDARLGLRQDDAADDGDVRCLEEYIHRAGRVIRILIQFPLNCRGAEVHIDGGPGSPDQLIPNLPLATATAPGGVVDVLNFSPGQLVLVVAGREAGPEV